MESGDSRSLSDLLLRLISTDLGCGHLENFNKSADVDIDLSYSGIPLYLACCTPHFTSLVVQGENVYGNYREKLQRYLVFFTAIPLRAPPVQA